MKISDFLKGVEEVKVNGPKIIASFDIGGLTINLTETILIGWLLIVVIAALCIFLTRGLRTKNISKRQVIAEMAVTTVMNLVEESMGKRFMNFAPYIATVFAYSIFGSLIGMLGFRPMTADFNTTFCWGIMTFLIVETIKIRSHGVRGYLKGFLDPIPVMLPLNLLSEVSLPVSLGFRHFGNIGGGMIITTLLYFALTAASNAIGAPIPFLTVGIPAVLSVYFDLFSGFMQAFIFISLTMAYMDSAASD